MVVLDASIVNVALPSIGRDLDFSQDDLSWVVNAYTLTFGGFLLLGGRLADLLGRRRMFIVGLVLFALASLAGGLAQRDGWLIAARAVQGLGAAMLSPAALSLVTDDLRRGRRAQQGAGRLGRGRRLRRRRRRAARRHADRVRRLGVGAVRQRADRPRRRVRSRRACCPRAATTARATSTSPARSRSPPASSLLVYALVDANNAGWGSTQTLGLVAVSLALLARVRRRSSAARAHPLVPFSIFRLRTLRGVERRRRCWSAMSLFSMFFFISLYMQQVLGYDALEGRLRLPAAGGRRSSSRPASPRSS